ncbi:hypothetical protein BN381_100097 [Candidatus Microthrix parvicella RN1]|uniref:Uncharacterized protein n=1 Tax=Candidatus Neomicrothrix parvicella RN1 TaxID=1229780 RepID=R4YWB8_9ACTN|nr:hypothetical protein BN381_100097 [Candidatus Microthrix parvicella RN1]
MLVDLPQNAESFAVDFERLFQPVPGRPDYRSLVVTGSRPAGSGDRSVEGRGGHADEREVRPFGRMVRVLPRRASRPRRVPPVGTTRYRL